ncbi:FmdB family transcriptional regulator [Cellulomonas dongxiuzhuiae]|uniref:FmdB family transcriptional regulator n=1 Tax=Cellulomonas dongxiuzhuiae TaxID=2819979 RepID=A0ABX8GMK9_9CELL|nr:FmdB family transcriptional regulator [Cellulomonas dongxiuzhuiae]QWC16841.1 FmdB family transcriptional regulator [Cellulomonas dongxiuzhuiae]
MPTYAYRCTACDHAFEAQQSFTDDALTVCPACEGRLRKVFSSVGVVFKGSGFYRNDARTGSASGRSGTSGGSGGSGTSGASTDTSSSTSSDTSTSTSSSTPAPSSAGSTSSPAPTTTSSTAASA